MGCCTGYEAFGDLLWMVLDKLPRGPLAAARMLIGFCTLKDNVHIIGFLESTMCEKCGWEDEFLYRIPFQCLGVERSFLLVCQVGLCEDGFGCKMVRAL